LRILLVRLRAIGDVVFTTPAVRALRERFTDSHITYIVEPVAAPVVASNRYIDELIVAPRAGIAADLALGRRLRRQQFDLAIDFHGGPRASLLTWLSRARRRIGYDVVARSWMYTDHVARPRELRARHSVVNQFDLLAPLGINPPERRQLPVEMAVEPKAAQALDGRLVSAGVSAADQLILLHVSAGNPFRRWPHESFAALAAALASSGENRRILITAGPSEQAAEAAVAGEARRLLGSDAEERVVACGSLSLAELRAACDRAALYIGGDSGPLHIASASRVPIVALYGPTLPARSEPWRDPGLPAERVEVTALPCRPCDQRTCAPGDFRCLTTITPEQVAAAAERALGHATAE
jgi:lipopolysaccharide heptosyltransferase II